MLFDQHQSVPVSDRTELNLLPPPGLTMSMPRSLLANLRYVFFPQRLPPLQLTSRPVKVGMLVGDILELPWYRTILANLGDLISPETQPPLQLESQPVEVELISDEPAWWGSLLRNLADTVAPERQPALNLTSPPRDPNMASQVLVTPRWSSLIETPVGAAPKLLLPDRWSPPPTRPARVLAPLRTTLVHLPSLDLPAEDSSEQQLVLQIKRQIRRSRIREIVWINMIIAEVTLLVVLRLLPH